MKKIIYLLAILFLLLSFTVPVAAISDDGGGGEWVTYFSSLNYCGGSNGGCYDD